MSAAGCLDNAGLEPPLGELNFPGPIAAIDMRADAVDAPTHLLVANTNFDLKYNGATLMTFDLDVANGAMDQTCGALADPARCAIVPTEAISGTEVDPGALTVARVDGMLTSEVIISSFADGIALSPDGRTAYLPMRSEADLTHVSLGEGGALACGGTGRHRCDPAFRFVNQELIAARDEDLPIEPVDVLVGSMTDFGRPAEEGNYAMMLHRDGAVSFMTHAAAGTPPRVIDVLEGLGSSFVTLTRDPSDGRFFAPSGSLNALSRVGLRLDANSVTVENAQLYTASPLFFSGLNTGSLVNARQVIVDPRATAPYAGRLYTIAASPEALLVGRAGTESNFVVEEVIDLGSQPTRAELIEIGGRYVIAVSCYTSRDLYFIDADLLRVIAVIRGFSGAFEIAFDEPRERLYVSDYRVSVLRFVDLAPLFDCVLDRVPPSPTRSCSPRLLGMMGIPNAVQQL
jgi:hypothetical protein